MPLLSRVLPATAKIRARVPVADWPAWRTVALIGVTPLLVFGVFLPMIQFEYPPRLAVALGR
ncbi:MAG: hypothetical protein M3Z06_12065 [Actinomycetota bacterium]|nr:hypothetical protein [Actinomycetota bacterium]